MTFGRSHTSASPTAVPCGPLPAGCGAVERRHITPAPGRPHQPTTGAQTITALVERLVNAAADLHHNTRADERLAGGACRVLATALCLEAQLRRLGPAALMLAVDLTSSGEEVAGLDR